MDLSVRIDVAGARPVFDPALAIAATAARQAGTRTARLAARIDARRERPDLGRHKGGSFHGGVAPGLAAIFVKPGFTVTF